MKIFSPPSLRRGVRRTGWLKKVFRNNKLFCFDFTPPPAEADPSSLVRRG